MEFTGRLGNIRNQAVSQPFLQYGRIVILVLFAWATVGPVQVLSASPPRLKSQTVIFVEVYNCTQVSRLEIREAERQAEEIFAKAGVRISWLDFLPEKHLVQSRLNKVAADFSVRILYTSKTTRPRRMFQVDTLGETTIPSGTEGPVPGGIVSVFVDRVYDSSTRWGLFSGEVLGDAIAHELGHLLLGAEHSSKGIMKGSWTSQDLHLAGRGKLRFSPDQVGLLQRAALSLRQNPSSRVIAER